MSEEKQKPTHEVYIVTKKANGEKGRWEKIGAMWAHKDGKGFGIKIPLLSHDGQSIEARVYQPKEKKSA